MPEAVESTPVRLLTFIKITHSNKKGKGGKYKKIKVKMKKKKQKYD